jgi:UDP-N-acetylglucosamine--N-acetylmuramyl-(pentapeptide) pyrophosphoryl-undecaprenol N-acetylglucosamine transferase
MDDHQAANAAVLEKAGAAWVIRQDALKAPMLTALLEDILAHPADLSERAGAAHRLGHPDAAARLADLVETLGTKP